MKLITIAALLFSTSVMAANLCKSDDVCVSFEPFDTEEKSFEIKCKDISHPDMSTNQYDMNVLSFQILKPVDVKSESSIAGFSVGSLYVLNQKYGEIRVESNVSDSMSTYVNDDTQLNAANALISCVDLLKSK
ncbi:hypothetical protein M2263_000132 [Providencia alcalifaciens]|nr:hypothetical protein [Providencia alcalifaciens]